MFVKAEKQDEPVRIAISGVSGSGKTYTALSLATTMAEGGRIAVVDTERGSSRKYASQFDFDVMTFMPPYHPARLQEMVYTAEAAGYRVLIVDSLSHFWNGSGGLLELVEQVATTKFKGNTAAAWSQATPIQNQMIDTLVSPDMHVIFTMRSRQKHTIVTDPETGTNGVMKLGLAPYQRDGVEYEADLHLVMQMDNSALVDKSRVTECPPGTVLAKPGADLANAVLDAISRDQDTDLRSRQRRLLEMAQKSTVMNLALRLIKMSLVDNINAAVTMIESSSVADGKTLQPDTQLSRKGTLAVFDELCPPTGDQEDSDENDG